MQLALLNRRGRRESSKEQRFPATARSYAQTVTQVFCSPGRDVCKVPSCCCCCCVTRGHATARAWEKFPRKRMSTSLTAPGSHLPFNPLSEKAAGQRRSPTCLCSPSEEHKAHPYSASGHHPGRRWHNSSIYPTAAYPLPAPTSASPSSGVQLETRYPKGQLSPQSARAYPTPNSSFPRHRPPSPWGTCPPTELQVLETPACNCTSPNLRTPSTVDGMVASKGMLIPRTCGCDLIWKKGLCGCDEGKDLEMRSSRLAQVSPKSNDWCPYRDRRQGKMKRGGHVTMEAESGVTCLPAEEHKWPPQKLERGTDSPSEPPEGTDPAHGCTVGLPSCENMNSRSFKPPGLWYFVTAAMGN